MKFYCIWKDNTHCWWDSCPIAPLRLCQLKWRAILQRQDRQTDTHTHTHTESLPTPPASPLCFYSRDKCSYIVEIPSVLQSSPPMLHCPQPLKQDSFPDGETLWHSLYSVLYLELLRAEARFYYILDQPSPAPLPPQPLHALQKESL